VSPAGCSPQSTVLVKSRMTESCSHLCCLSSCPLRAAGTRVTQQQLTSAFSPPLALIWDVCTLQAKIRQATVDSCNRSGPRLQWQEVTYITEPRTLLMQSNSWCLQQQARCRACPACPLALSSTCQGQCTSNAHCSPACRGQPEPLPTRVGAPVPVKWTSVQRSTTNLQRHKRQAPGSTPATKHQAKNSTITSLGQAVQCIACMPGSTKA
jgi:hypothetical protein